MKQTLWGVVRLSIYVCLLFLPLVVIRHFHPSSMRGRAWEAGLACGMLAATIVLMQFVLSARIRWIERPFGLDMIFRFHKAIGFVALTLAFAHPFFIAGASDSWDLIYSPGVSMEVWLGRIALLLLVTIVVLSYWRRAFGLEYQLWRRLHNAAVASILLLILLHSLWRGPDFKESPELRAAWIAFFAVPFAVYLHHKIVRPLLLKRRAYTVAEVVEETHNVRTVRFMPPEGVRRFDFHPGQFHFVTFYAEGDLAVEEHPWTICWTPTREGLASTIKELGDFTKKIGRVKPGDRAAIQGPFGRFSYALYPDEKEFVFICGGIGVTPIMAMIRHMHDVKSDHRVVLLWANRTEADIAFRGELETIAESGRPRLRVVHFLSEADEAWNGETGHITEEKIRHYRDGAGLSDPAYYICAPAAMTNQMLAILKKMEIAPKRIHTEQFSL